MLDMEAATSLRAIAVPTAGGGLRFRAEQFRWAGAADYPHGGYLLKLKEMDSDVQSGVGLTCLP